jgi:hypothetical protein
VQRGRLLAVVVEISVIPGVVRSEDSWAKRFSDEQTTLRPAPA